MATDADRDQLERDLERTLLEQARRTELVIARLRAACLPVFFLTDFVTWWRPEWLGAPQVPARLWLTSGTAALLALGFARVMGRGWYRPWLRQLMPVFDAALITFALHAALTMLGPAFFVASGSLATVALLCVLLALSGAFRFSRASVALATALAVSIYLGFSLQLMVFHRSNVVHVAMLLAVGGLGLAMTSIVKRAVRSEVGRQTLARFLPQHVVDAAHADPLALLREPRTSDASVLVSDLRGFTAWAEGRPPAEVLTHLDRIQGALANAVQTEGGVVDKFMGDGLLAAFGAVEPLPDHADRAVRAAKAMMRAVDALNSGREEEQVAVRIGLGVHSGPVLSGCLGSSGRLEFTILGDTVNVASRLESLTKDQGVALLVSAETVNRCIGDHGLVSRGEVAVRGRRGALGVWSEAGGGDVRGSQLASISRLVAEVIDREEG